MTVYYAFAEYTHWPQYRASHSVSVDTGSSRRRSENTRLSYFFADGDNEYSIDHAPVSDGWFGAYLRAPTQTASPIRRPVLLFLDDQENAFFWIECDHPSVYFNSVINQDRIEILTDGEEGEIAVQFQIGENGFFRVFKGGTQVFFVEGDTQNGFGTSVKRLQHNPVTNSTTGGSSGVSMSEIILSDEPTIDFRVITLPVSQGSEDDWSGDVGDINADGWSSLSDALTTDSADALITFNKDAMPSLDPECTITSLVFETVLFGESGTPVPHVDILAYDDGTEYVGSSVTPSVDGSSHSAMWTSDPRDGSAWEVSTVDQIEVGLAARS